MTSHAFNLRLAGDLLAHVHTRAQGLGMSPTSFLRHLVASDFDAACKPPLTRRLPGAYQALCSYTSSPDALISSPSKPDPDPEVNAQAQGPSVGEVLAEVVRLFNELRKTKLTTMDQGLETAVCSRLRGYGLAPGDRPATAEEIYTVVRHACASYGKRHLRPAAIISNGNFWDTYTAATATEPATDRKGKPIDRTCGGIVPDVDQWLADWTAPKPPKEPTP